MYYETTATHKIAKLHKKIRAVQGGTSASKTISILIVLISMAQTDEEPTLTSIVAESLPHLKKGALRDFKKIMKTHNYWNSNNWSETDKIYTFETGSQIEFFGSDQPEKLRGGRRDRGFMNECNNMSLESFDEFEVRTRDFVFLDWNPTIEFWFYDDVLGSRDDVEHLILTYKDNEACPPEIVASIEQRKNRTAWWRVYGLGLLGEVEGRIYTGWKVIDEIPHEAKLIRYCLDFGYTNDPAAIVAMYSYNGGYIFDEILYKKGQSNKNLADTIINLEEPALTVADSSEPKSIDEIKDYGVNIVGAVKRKEKTGPHKSYNAWAIEKVQEQKISVTKRSTNILKEYRGYLWAMDKDGKVLNEPEDINDHCFVGDTLITTKQGNVSIKNISVGDLVLTSNGYKKVLLKHNNGNKYVYDYSLHFATHSVKITCTPDHKIKTGDTWTEISKLKPGQTVNYIKPLMVKNTFFTKMKGILQARIKKCIGLCMNFIMGIYQKISTSITRMEILTTISPKISKLLKARNMYKTTAKRNRNGLLKTYNRWGLKKLKSGTQAMKGENGILLMVKKLGKIENIKNIIARNVVKNFHQDMVVKSNSVIQTAVLESLEEDGKRKEEVFDLTVEHAHEYFANEILVHNCMDAIKYGVVSVINPEKKSVSVSQPIWQGYNKTTAEKKVGGGAKVYNRGIMRR